MDLSSQSYCDREDDTVGAGTGTGGDHVAALRDCLVQHYHRLHRRLLRYLGCSDLAGDCLHDTWLRLGEMDIPAAVSHPQAYVYRVACNLALDRLRGNRLRQPLADPDIAETIADPFPGPEQIAEARSELAAVDRAMESLPWRCQSVLTDLRIDGLTRQEAAARLGLSLRRVDSMLRQTLDQCALYAGQEPPSRRGTTTPK